MVGRRPTLGRVPLKTDNFISVDGYCVPSLFTARAGGVSKFIWTEEYKAWTYHRFEADACIAFLKNPPAGVGVNFQSWINFGVQ